MESLRKEHSWQKHKDRVLKGPECVLVMDQQGGPCGWGRGTMESAEEVRERTGQVLEVPQATENPV